MNSGFAEWLPDFITPESFWVYQTFAVVLLTFSAVLLASWVLNKISIQAQKTKTLWDDALVFSCKKPVKWLILFIGLTVAAELAVPEPDSKLAGFIDSFRHLFSIFIVTWFLFDFLKRVETNIVDPTFLKKPLDNTTAVAIGKLLRASVVITSVLVSLQTLGYSISGVLAFGGIGGIAVGFAAKDLLANFFGGLMIYLDRPFAVGDWVRSPDQEIEGIIEDIGWRLTTIRTFDKRPLYVPNSTFMQISVENPSRMTNRRIYETIGIRYDDVNLMPQIISQVKEMLNGHKDIDQTHTLIVNFDSFAQSSLDFFIYCFTETTDWITFHEVKQDVLLKVIKIIEDNGAECAFPTSTIHLAGDVRNMME